MEHIKFQSYMYYTGNLILAPDGKIVVFWGMR